MHKVAPSEPAHDTAHDPASPADGVVIRRLASLDEFEEAVTIQDETWGAGFSERVPAAILNVAQKVGGVTAGAFGPDGRLLGFVFGLTGIRDDRLVHWSDMLAVRVEARGRHLGDRLKQFQRDCVRDIGVDTMLWTFDPLVARNAHFNLNRLGARPVEYVPNMYGANTGSPLHGRMETDRWIAAWRLDGSRPTPLPEGTADEAPAAIHPGLDGLPALGTLLDAPYVRIPIPPDLQEVQRTAPTIAAQWRVVTRAAFLHYLGRGYAVVGFARPAAPGGDGDGALPGYILARTPVPQRTPGEPRPR